MKFGTILCYSCNSYHEHNSKKMFGVFSTIGRAINELKRTYGKTIFNDNDLRNLTTIRQTQGKQINFILDEIKINKKL